MATFLLSLFLIALAIAGLALGILFGRPPIKGSCGGLNCVKSADCGACRSREVR